MSWSPTASVWNDADLSKLHLSVGGHELLRSGGKTLAIDPKSMAMYLPSRPLLECHVRRRVQAMPNVTILANHDVAELIVSSDRSRVTEHG